MKLDTFSDLHQHVLWGLDDGSQTPEQMRALLRQNVENGIGVVFATAHACPNLRPFRMNVYRERLAEANEYCRNEGLPLRVLSGCEIRYSDSVPDHLMDGRLPTLGGTSHVLIEFDPESDLSELEGAADKLYIAGYQPVVAHVERYRCLVKAPERAIEIREECGLLFQMNCDTILKARGFRLRRFVKRMLEARAIDAVATDAHNTVDRPVRMREAYLKLVTEQGIDYAERLVHMGWQFAGKE